MASSLNAYHNSKTEDYNDFYSSLGITAKEGQAKAPASNGKSSSASIKEQRREQLAQRSRQTAQPARQTASSDPIAQLLYAGVQQVVGGGAPQARAQSQGTQYFPKGNGVEYGYNLRTGNYEAKRPGEAYDTTPMFPPNTDLAGKPKGGTVLAGNGPIPASVDARVNARNLALNRQFEQQQGGDGGAMTAATYTVKAGDTLSSIAKRMTGDPNAYRQIAAANGIKDPNKIKVGQVIRIGGAPVKSPTTPPVAPKSATGAKTAVATQLSVARPSASFSSGSSSGFRSSEQANRSGGFNDQIASGMRGL